MSVPIPRNRGASLILLQATMAYVAWETVNCFVLKTNTVLSGKV